MKLCRERRKINYYSEGKHAMTGISLESYKSKIMLSKQLYVETIWLYSGKS